MANSEFILSNQTHPGDSTLETITGDKYKGDGYYGRSDGLHTVAWSLSGFTGTLRIQGTLAIDPLEEDWTTVYTYEATQESANNYTNFTGNYVWVRAIVEYTDGTVNSVSLNH